MTTAQDFLDGPIADLGISVTRTPVTMETSNLSGQKTYFEGTTASITVVFENINQKYSLTEAGLTQGADARMYVKSTDTVNKYDLITFNGKKYRVDSVSPRVNGAEGTAFYTVLLFITDTA